MADVNFNRQTVIDLPNKNVKITTGIEMGSMVIKEILTQSTPNYNEANSNSFEVRVFGIDDISGEYIQIYQIIDGDETKPVYLFSGYVDSCKSDVFGHYRTIVAYDAFYIGKSIDVASYWNALASEGDGVTPLYALSFVCEKVGIQIAASTLHLLDAYGNIPGITMQPQEHSEITRYEDDGTPIVSIIASSFVDHLSFVDFIIQFCQLFGVYPNITRDGLLEFITFNNNNSYKYYQLTYKSGSYNSEISNKRSKIINGAPHGTHQDIYNDYIEGANAEYQPYTVFPGFDYVSVNDSSGNSIVISNDSWLQYPVRLDDGSTVIFDDRRGGNITYSISSSNIFLKYYIERYEYNRSSLGSNSVYTKGSEALLHAAVDAIAQFYNQNKEHTSSADPKYSIHNKLDYIPMSLPLIVSDLRIHLGDYIVTERGSTFAMQLTLSGSQLVNQTIASSGNATEQSISATSLGGVAGQMQQNAQQVQAYLESLTIKKVDTNCITNEMLIDGSIDFAKMNSAFIGNLVADDLFAKELKAEVAKIGALTVDDLSAETGDFSKLTAKSAFIQQLYAPSIIGEDAILGNLQSTIVTTDDLTAKVANITSLSTDSLFAGAITTALLTADSAFIRDLKANVIDASYISAATAALGYVTATQLSTTYAQIDFANVNAANIEQAKLNSLFSNSAYIKEIVSETGAITQYLDVVKINADVIDAGTLAVDRLIIKGTEDSILYKLNEGSITTETITKEMLENQLHGEHIIADTITANKINMTSLVGSNAFISQLATSDLWSQSITASNLNITGGTVNVTTSSSDESIISLNYSSTSSYYGNYNYNNKISAVSERFSVVYDSGYNESASVGYGGIRISRNDIINGTEKEFFVKLTSDELTFSYANSQSSPIAVPVRISADGTAQFGSLNVGGDIYCADVYSSRLFSVKSISASTSGNQITIPTKSGTMALTSDISTYNFYGVDFYSGNYNTSEHNANNATKNGNYYYTSNGPGTTLGASTSDGALYVQSYNDNWVGQIAQDYRNGRLFIRGKNNGTWQGWKRVANYDEIPTNTNQLTNGAGFITSNGSCASATKATQDGNGDIISSTYFKHKGWKSTSDKTFDANDLRSGIVFAYSTAHKHCATVGVLVGFGEIEGSLYTLQLQGNYGSDNELYFRNRNGDNGTWNSWRKIIHSGNIGSQSVNYANNAGQLGGVNATDYATKTYVGNNFLGTNFVSLMSNVYVATPNVWNGYGTSASISNSKFIGLSWTVADDAPAQSAFNVVIPTSAFIQSSQSHAIVLVLHPWNPDSANCVYVCYGNDRQINVYRGSNVYQYCRFSAVAWS